MGMGKGMDGRRCLSIDSSDHRTRLARLGVKNLLFARPAHTRTCACLRVPFKSGEGAAAAEWKATRNTNTR